jgi:hypothetical protein
VIREGLPCSTCSCSPRAHNTPRISRTHLRPRWTLAASSSRVGAAPNAQQAAPCATQPSAAAGPQGETTS